MRTLYVHIGTPKTATTSIQMFCVENQKVLNKRHINTLERETASLGPIMVSPDYVGNGYMLEMLEIFNEYCISIGIKYIFTKAHSKNLFSINNMYKDGYKLVDEYENERGRMSAFLKEL